VGRGDDGTRDKRLEEISTNWELIAFYFFLRSIVCSFKLIVIERTERSIVRLTKAYDKSFD